MNECPRLLRMQKLPWLPFQNLLAVLNIVRTINIPIYEKEKSLKIEVATQSQNFRVHFLRHNRKVILLLCSFFVFGRIRIRLGR